MAHGGSNSTNSGLEVPATIDAFNSRGKTPSFANSIEGHDTDSFGMRLTTNQLAMQSMNQKLSVPFPNTKNEIQ